MDAWILGAWMLDRILEGAAFEFGGTMLEIGGSLLGIEAANPDDCAILDAAAIDDATMSDAANVDVGNILESPLNEDGPISESDWMLDDGPTDDTAA